MALKTRKDELKIETFATGAGSGLRIQTDGNETGLLFRISAVFYVQNLEIVSASIKTPQNQVIDEFVVRRKQGDSELTAAEIEPVRRDLKLLLDGLSVLEYLGMRAGEMPPARKSADPGAGPARVEIFQEAFGPVIRLQGRDRSGLMLTLTQTFFLTDIDIQAASIRTEADGTVINTFEVNPADLRFTNNEFCRRLSEELRVLL